MWLPLTIIPDAKYKELVDSGLYIIKQLSLEKLSVKDWSILLGYILGFIRLYKGLSELCRKCCFGKGTKFMVISFKSTLRSPSYLMEQVRLLITLATMAFSFSKWFPFFFLPTSRTDESSLICCRLLYSLCFILFYRIVRRLWRLYQRELNYPLALYNQHDQSIH